MEFFDSLTNIWLWVCLGSVVVIYYFAHRDGFEDGVVAGVEKTLDELVKEGLLYIDEREELKRRKP